MYFHVTKKRTMNCVVYKNIINIIAIFTSSCMSNSYLILVNMKGPTNVTENYTASMHRHGHNTIHRSFTNKIN